MGMWLIMNPCYFAQWDAGKSPNCTWTQGGGVCQQYPALTSAFMCYLVRQSRAFFIVPFIVKKVHATDRHYYQRGPNCSFITWFLSDDSSLQSGWKYCPWWCVTWTASSVATPVWHLAQDRFPLQNRTQANFQRENGFIPYLFSLCKLWLSAGSLYHSKHFGSWQVAGIKQTHRQLFPNLHPVFAMLEEALDPQGEAETSSNNTGRLNTSIHIVRGEVLYFIYRHATIPVKK